MELFWKSVILVLISAFLYLFLNSQHSEFGLLLTLAATAMVALVFAHYLQPVLELLRRLEDLGRMDADMLPILLKALGIGLTAEISGLVCTDAGNGTLAKVLQQAASAAILYVSLPVFNAMLDLLHRILGGV